MIRSRVRWLAAFTLVTCMALAVSSSGDAGDEDTKEINGTVTSAIKTSPTAARVRTGNDFVFAVIGDYGDDDDDTRRVADMFLGWNTDFIVTVGDNDYSDGAHAGTMEGMELGVGQFFHECIGNYQGTYGAGSAENRFFPVPGDHDWGDNCDNPAALDDYLAYFTLPDDGPGGERYYQFRHGPVQFFAIDSPWGCDPDGIEQDSAQAQWVRAEAAASDALFKVAVLHHAPYTSGHHGPEDGEHVQWPWADWGFDLVLSGHDHDYERLERDGVTYIVNGLGGVDRRGFLNTINGSLVRYPDNYGAMQITVMDSAI